MREFLFVFENIVLFPSCDCTNLLVNILDVINFLKSADLGFSVFGICIFVLYNGNQIQEGNIFEHFEEYCYSQEILVGIFLRHS